MTRRVCAMMLLFALSPKPAEARNPFADHRRAQADVAALTTQTARSRDVLRATRRAVSDAQSAARLADDNAASAAAQAARSAQRLTAATARYVATATAVAWSPAAAGPSDITAIAAHARSSRDAMLLFAQSRLVLDDLNDLLDVVRTRSRDAAAAADAADRQRQAARTAREHAARASARAARHLRALRTALDAARNRKRRAARRVLESLLDDQAGALTPIAIPADMAGVPIADRIVLLSLRELARDVAEQPLGSNDSADIARYRSATVGAVPGAPWCAYFVSYIAARAGRPIGSQGSGLGYVPNVRSWARQAGRWLTRAVPKPGDVVTWPQHVGIVIAVDGPDIITVEGNSSHRVARNRRALREVTGFIRLAGSRPTSGDALPGHGVTPDGTA